jgi:hypothetical protein
MKLPVWLITIASLFVGLCFDRALAQDNSPARGFVVEITAPSYQSPVYAVVTQEGIEPYWFTPGRFDRIKAWSPPEGFLRILGVKFTSGMDGSSARIRMSLWQGAKVTEKETQVATYVLREGESAITTELKQYGIEPFTLKLVRASSRMESPAPFATNNTTSIEVLGFDLVEATPPYYEIVLRNHSTKNVLQMHINYYTAEGTPICAWPRDLQDRILIKSGEVFRFGLLPSPQGLVSGAEFIPQRVVRVLIVTALFDDDTFEGDVNQAGSDVAARLGKKIEITRLLGLISSTLDESDLDTPAALARFRKRVTEGRDIDPAWLEAMLHRFPYLEPQKNPWIGSGIRSSIQIVKQDCLKNLDQTATSNAGRQYLRPWLEATKRIYEEWLKRLL